ncbi:hypothetical protein BGZ65_002550, partial [Modicella reniformis]
MHGTGHIKPSSTSSNQSTTKTAAAALAQSTGTTLWNKFRAARDVINATISGEERWPDSDDSDYEGESHVSRVLREYADKKESQEIAAKIAELDNMADVTPPITPVTPVSFVTPVTPTTPVTPVIPERSGSITRHQDLREAIRKNIQVNTNPSLLGRSSATGNHNNSPSHHTRYSPLSPSPLTASPTTPSGTTGGGSKDYYGQSLRAR